MPRKNNSRKHSTNRGRRPGKPSHGRKHAPIDWEAIEAKVEGKDPARKEPRRRRPLPNEFTRELRGLSPEAIELMIRYGFDNIDDNGFVTVRFSGISQKPLKEIPYEKPGIVRTGGGIMVISGVVDSASIEEIGVGTRGISQVDAPVLDSHNSDRRLNVALGRGLPGLDEQALAKEISGSGLALSAVATINGSEVKSKWEIDEMWNHPEPEPAWLRADDGFISTPGGGLYRDEPDPWR
ncbi:MAG TPA: hypothetical protein VFX86_00535 [Candidatus Saccharimonadales bacterium]|nr:hypothetical protein [Candidatus Saccharimonadales bacterium]